MPNLSEQVAEISKRLGALEIENIGDNLPLTIIYKSYSTLGLQVSMNIYRHKYYQCGQNYLGQQIKTGLGLGI